MRLRQGEKGERGSPWRGFIYYVYCGARGRKAIVGMEDLQNQTNYTDNQTENWKKNNSLRQRKKVSVSSARCGLGNLLWSRSRNFRHLRTWNPGRGSDLGAAIRGRRCRRHNRRLVDNFGGVQVISGAYTRTGGDQVDGSWHTHSGRN